MFTGPNEVSVSANSVDSAHVVVPSLCMTLPGTNIAVPAIGDAPPPAGSWSASPTQ